MKGILIDENLPIRLSLPTALEVRHVSILGDQPTDSAIWTFAKAHDLVIVTKDADFSQRIAVSSPPPRVVHLRIGNLRLNDLVVFLDAKWPQIESHFPRAKLVDVYCDRLEVAA